jgi:hypothetical protein
MSGGTRDQESRRADVVRDGGPLELLEHGGAVTGACGMTGVYKPPGR